MTDHPITPPPELVARWKDYWFDAKIKHINLEDYILAQAAQWGADQELESSIELLKADGYKALARDLCAARRPNPPTLKEQGLESLNEVIKCLKVLVPDAPVDGIHIENIRRSLEALPND